MAAKLILSIDGTVINEYALKKERMTIGRRAHNDIVIDNLAVSGEHASIVTIMNDSFLEDMGSTNGTLVNAVATKKHFLQNNDVIEIGKYKLKYINDQTGQVNATDFDKTMVLRPSARHAVAENADAANDLAKKPIVSQTQILPITAVDATKITASFIVNQPPHEADAPTPVQTVSPVQTASPAVLPTPTPTVNTASAPRSVAVQILNGSNAGKEMELVKNLTTLGKPGQVAVITRRPQGYFITHVEGANHPIVNGKPLGDQPQQLNDHDVIELAGVKMEFYYKI